MTQIHTNRIPRKTGWARHGDGFTLIELMIAVAIVAILAAIGYPSYQEHVRKARRTEVQADLLSLGAAMERHFSDNNTYATATIGTAAGAIFPNWSPASGPQADRYYDLSFTPAATTTAYTIRATPLASKMMKENGMLELDSTGARWWDENDSGTKQSGETW